MAYEDPIRNINENGLKTFRKEQNRDYVETFYTLSSYSNVYDNVYRKQNNINWKTYG